MKTMSIFMLMLSLFGACSQKATPEVTAAEVLQTAGAQITAFINRDEKTISVLYGDSAALESAQSDFKHHSIEEHFTLVTYKLENFYYDQDAQARGTVERVEKMSNPDSKNSGEFAYTIPVGKRPLDSTGARYQDSDRIKFIFSHKPYQYPQAGDINL